MSWRSNGGYFGPRPTGPSTEAASGWWDSRSQFRLRRDSQWPVNGDPFWSNVSLLLHMDGSNGSTTFTDSSSSAVTVTANGNAQISTTQSKFGGASGLFDGTGDYLSFSTITLSGDFTVEAWVYKTARDASSYTMVFSGPGASGANNCQFSFDDNVEGSVGIVLNGAYVVRNAGTQLTSNTWHHVAWCRSNGLVRVFLNGSLLGAGTSTASALIANVARWPGGGFEMNGNLDDLRVTSAARYTENFTPPSAPFLDGP
jgi:hypothetical protein